MLLASVLVGGAGAPAAGGPAETRPNILVILTDDQRATETLEAMPRTMEWFGDGGTTFTNAYATTPVCCPSRAAIMTGRFNHNNGVRTNTSATSLDQEHTIQEYLQDAGYRTAMVGKYLNSWPPEDPPPNFDRSSVLIPQGDTYMNNQFNNDGVLMVEPGYSTDVIRDKAVALLQTDLETVDTQPWFLMVTPFAPHHPWEPAERHANEDVGTWNGNPAVFEKNDSDKPPYVQRANRSFAHSQEVRRGQLRSLQAVDELVQAIRDQLLASDEENTLAIFLSDNGFMWSEHGMQGKSYPYTASIRIPMMARWPGHVAPGTRDGSPVANLDVTPTIAEAAELPEPPIPYDGRSLLEPGRRQKMLTEAWTGRGGWASIRSSTYHYIENYRASGKIRIREYYDLRRDPWELRNLFGDRQTSNDPYPGALHGELAAARRCVGAGCSALLGAPPVPTRCAAGRKKDHHLVGSPTGDRIRGSKTRDVACGEAGDDRLAGKKGNDLLIGGLGHDVCRGGPGRDQFRGCEVRS
jgi:arylsulfatase A-like enzyme